VFDIFNRQEIIDYLAPYGWTEKRCVHNLDISKIYSRFFDYLENDEELTLDEFLIYKPFPKLLDFWNSFGGLDIKFTDEYGRSGAVAINENSVKKCPDFSVIQASIHYGIPIFPVAMVEKYELFLALDSRGVFHGLHFDGAVSHFPMDFLEVLDIFINSRPMPDKHYFPKHE